MSPGSGSPLADLSVQFSLDGQAALQAALDSIKGQIDKLVSAVGQFHFDMINTVRETTDGAKKAADSVNALSRAFDRAGQTVNQALGLGVGAVANFVRQGAAASALGQQWGVQMERLSLTIAGLFRPELEKLIGFVERLSDRLARMTDAQRAGTARLVEGAAAALAVGAVLPKLSGAVQALTGGIAALGAAMSGALSSTGVGALLPVIGVVTQAAAALPVSTESGRKGLEGMADAAKHLGQELAELGERLHLSDYMQGFLEAVGDIAEGAAEAVHELTKLVELLSGAESKDEELQRRRERKAVGAFFASPLVAIGKLFGEDKEEAGKKGDRGPLAGRAGGLESLEATYARVARASIMSAAAGKSPEERSADELEAIRRFLEDVKRRVENPPPEVAR